MTTIKLPAAVDRRAAPGLAVEISDAFSKGSDLTLDGSAVQQVGQIGLQLLLSAFRTASNRDAAIAIVDGSPALLNAAKIAGASDHLGMEA